jgi:hypothetical protein
VAGLDYRDLDELEAFQGRNSTAEAVAHHLFQQISPRLRDQGLASLLVRIWESERAYAAYEGAMSHHS